MSIKHPTLNPGVHLYIARDLKKNTHHVQKEGRQVNSLLCPTINPGWYPYVSRAPHFGKLAKAYNDKCNKINEDNLTEHELTRKDPDNDIKFAIQAENRVQYLQIQADIKRRVQAKIQAYEEAVDKRREKLHELLYKEEREYLSETVDMAMKREANKYEEKKKILEQIKVQREEERKKLAHKKRIEQYINLCQELKPALIKQHLIESKNCQLQQMRENEARRQAEKELDKMWHELKEKENRARVERDEREALARKAEQLSVQEILCKQVRGKELLKAEEKKMALEDKMEMERLREQMRTDEIEKYKAKRRSQQAQLRELEEQMRVHEELVRKHKEEDEAISKVYIDLNEFEIQKEKAAKLEKIERFKKETAVHREYLEQAKAERAREEKEMEAFIENYKKEIEKKIDEAQCKKIFAKKELEKSVYEGRVEQIALRRQEAENQLKQKRAENELIRLAFETNQILQAESDRVEFEVLRQYRDDLKQQIEYNNLLRERERQELERQLQKGKEEEEYYQNLVKEIIKINMETPDMKHPFRRVLERHDCRCKQPPF